MLPEIRYWAPNFSIGQTADLMRALLPIVGKQRLRAATPDRIERWQETARRAGDHVHDEVQTLYQLCCQRDPAEFWSQTQGDVPLWELCVDAQLAVIPVALTPDGLERFVDDLTSMVPRWIPESAGIDVWVPAMLVVVGPACPCCRPAWCQSCDGVGKHRNYHEEHWTPRCADGVRRFQAIQRLQPKITEFKL